MSIKVIQWVWDCSESKNAERLVLLAIADNAADDGTRAYPSVIEIARKANLSERGVQAAIARLVKSGELSVKIGGGRGRVNMYTVIMKPCSRRKTPQDVHPSDPASPGETPQNDVETPQNDAVNPADSAPGTVPEPSKEPSGSSCDADAPPLNAGLILKGFIDYTSAKGMILTKRVIGHLAKEIKNVADEGFDDLTIRRALALMFENGQAGHPSQLPNYVVKVQRPPATPRAPQFKNSEEQGIERKRIRQARAKVLDALMEQGRTFDQAKAEVEGLADEDFLKLVAPSSATGYIEGDVIDSEQRPEVES